MILTDGSRVNLYHPDHRASEFHLFLGCNNPLVLNWHDDKLRHGYYSCRSWPWTHQQMVQCWWFQIWRRFADMRQCRRWSEVSLNHLSRCLERYPAATKPRWTYWQRHGIQYTRSILRWSSAMRENISPHATVKDIVFFQCCRLRLMST